MATRNRTPFFRKYRDALQKVRQTPYNNVASSSSSTPSTSSQGPVIELSTGPIMRRKSGYTMVSIHDVDSPRAGAVVVSLPPAWVDISEQISDDMQRARGRMNELRKVHAKALMPTFADNDNEQQTIESLTREITSHLKKSEKNLRRLSMGGVVDGDARLRKNVQRSLATNLQSLSMEFRKQQKSYLERLQQQQDASTGANLEVDKSSPQEDEWRLKQQQMALVKKVETQTVEREKEITQLTESVNELAQIMKDLSVLVIDQGTIVDRIDYNVQNVVASVEQGVKELEKAEKTQKKGRMVLCIMILVCLCIFMIFVLIIKSIIFR